MLSLGALTQLTLALCFALKTPAFYFSIAVTPMKFSPSGILGVSSSPSTREVAISPAELCWLGSTAFGGRM